MSINSDKRNFSILTVIAFFVTLTLCFSLIFVMILNRSNVERLTMEQLIFEKSIKINEVMSKLLYKTQMLSSLVLQNEGEVNDFDLMAAIIVDDPAILNILIAPGGVVSNVYPLEGNEAVIGLNFFEKGAGNREALEAMETGQLVLGGPFNAIQGGQILVGRLPVFIDGTDGSKHFWGLVSVTLKYPQALEGAGLDTLKTQGFAYEIWRTNPDTHERQIIANSGNSYSRKPYIDRHIPILNADWYFRVLSVRSWYEFPETWVSIIISFCLSFLVASITQSNRELVLLKNELETLSNTDSLTGIYNRRCFMDSAARHMSRIARTDGEAFIIIFDLDYFKLVNDKHGHQVGDMVLKEIAARVLGALRPYDLLARYGGEEFIALAADIDQKSAIALAERIRLDIANTPIEANGIQIPITASFGVAPAVPSCKLEAAITLADNALYKSKEDGRNRVTFIDHDPGD